MGIKPFQDFHPLWAGCQAFALSDGMCLWAALSLGWLIVELHGHYCVWAESCGSVSLGVRCGRTHRHVAHRSRQARVFFSASCPCCCDEQYCTYFCVCMWSLYQTGWTMYWVKLLAFWEMQEEWKTWTVFIQVAYKEGFPCSNFHCPSCNYRKNRLLVQGKNWTLSKLEEATGTGRLRIMRLEWVLKTHGYFANIFVKLEIKRPALWFLMIIDAVWCGEAAHQDWDIQASPSNLQQASPSA